MSCPYTAQHSTVTKRIKTLSYVIRGLQYFLLVLQGTASFSANQWSSQQHDWVKLVYSALIYMSGSSGGNGSFLKELFKKCIPQECLLSL